MMATMKYGVLTVLLYAIPAVATATVFHTNCTRPAAGSAFNFITAPNTRGTLDILWSCLFTVLICTWSVQHLSVPSKAMTAVDLFLRKPIWMIVTLLAPELIFGIALQEFLVAGLSLKLMKNTPEFGQLVQDGGLTMTHAFYANMGGFILRERISDREQEMAELTATNAGSPTTMTGFRPFVRVSVPEIITSLQSGLIRSPPDFITKSEIRDKTKGDMFLKCIAAFQVLWFIIQVCARKAQNLPISQLEIAVLAFCTSTLTTYVLWMKKPEDLMVPSYLDATRPLSHEEKQKLYDSSEDLDNLPGYDFFMSLPEFILPFRIQASVGALGFAIGGTIFGAIHILGWNLHFPTSIEKTLWRYFSVASAVIPGILFSMAVAFDREWETLSTALYVLALSVYTICRVFLMVETLRSLGFLRSQDGRLLLGFGFLWEFVEIDSDSGNHLMTNMRTGHLFCGCISRTRKLPLKVNENLANPNLCM